MSYHAGDHLGVLPRNRPAAVRRVLDRFGLYADSRAIIRRDEPGTTHLPLGVPVRVADVIAEDIELQDTATRGQVRTLVDQTSCPPERAALGALAGDDEAAEARYRAEVLAGHLSVLDLLEQFPACELSFEEFLGMLPHLRPRYYSISSSPMANERVASITVAVVDVPARSGRGRYAGVASSYLADLAPGDEIYGFVRDPGTAFRPPADPRTPMIMVGAGTGLAPFRGFLQERAALKDRGHEVGPSLLFFGCRSHEHDFLYEDELRDDDARGLTRLITAFLRLAGRPKCYVQHKLAEHADEVWDLLERARGLRLRRCRSYVPGRAPPSSSRIRGETGDAAAGPEKWLNELRSSRRYVEDVWASG